MKITFVIDSFDDCSNGITMTTRRFAKVLHERGHQINILAGSVLDTEYVTGYSLGICKTPILYQVSKKQGFYFSKINKKIINKCLDNTDICHFLLPFKLERVVKKMCDKRHIKTTAAFHLQPENISSSIKLAKSKCINRYIYKKFSKFYNKFDYIHCPSEMIKNQLIINNYKSKHLVVISNGVSKKFHKMDIEKTDEFKDKFVIMMIGRYSREKRQDLIINAVLNSKYEKNIQIVLAGKGPLLNEYKDLSKKLTNPVIFRFFSEDDLIKMINMTDLYVHASDAEIEGMGCIEPLACGVVPVISDSKLSATNQFAIDDLNLFKQGDYLSLRDKIDFWIENADLKEKRSQEYLEFKKKYELENCVTQLEDIFKKVLSDEKVS